jgi:hypothetical protein
VTDVSGNGPIGYDWRAEASRSPRIVFLSIGGRRSPDALLLGGSSSGSRGDGGHALAPPVLIFILLVDGRAVRSGSIIVLKLASDFNPVLPDFALQSGAGDPQQFANLPPIALREF